MAVEVVVASTVVAVQTMDCFDADYYYLTEAEEAEGNEAEHQMTAVVSDCYCCYWLAKEGEILLRMVSAREETG